MRVAYPGEKTIHWIAVLLTVLTGVIQVLYGEAGDKSWLLAAAAKWLRGEALYVDILEVNPPLIIWICAVSTKLHQWFPVLMDFQWHALLGVLTVCAVSIMCGYWANRAYGSHATYPVMREAALVVAFVQIVCVSVGYFFDREHIFITLVLPYLFRLMPSVRHVAAPYLPRIVTGFVAGIGFCIKPHCIIFLLAVKIYCAVQDRKMASFFLLESAIIYFMGVVYIVAAYLIHPDYFTVILPLISAVYAGYADRVGLVMYFTIAFALSAVSFVDFRFSQQSPYRRDIHYWMYLMVAGIAYALSNNGWGYTLVPYYTCMLIASWLVLRHHLCRPEVDFSYKKRCKQRAVQGRNACVMNIFLNGLIGLSIVPYTYFFVSCEDYVDCLVERTVVNTLQEYKPKSFGTLSEDFFLWSSVARRSSAYWVLPSNNFWTHTTYAEKVLTPSQRETIDHFISARVVDAIEKEKPELIFVDYLPSMTVTNYMRASAKRDFRWAEAWEGYRVINTINHCGQAKQDARKNCAFTVYRRILRE